MEDDGIDSRELLWRQYEQNVGLFKFYLELVIKMNLYYYVVTGGIMTLYFANNAASQSRFILVFPGLMSLALCGLFLRGAFLMKPIRQEIFQLRDALGFSVAPDAGILSLVLCVFAFLYFVVAIGLAAFFWTVS